MKREFVDSSNLFEGGSEQILVLLILAGLALFLFLRNARSGSWTNRRRFTKKPVWRSNKQVAWQPRVVPASKPSIADPEAQMRAISKVHFEKRRLLNKTEYRVLCILERVVSENGSGHRIMAQTSLGELIQPRSNSGTDDMRRDAYASVNSKRLDFAIVDRYGLLALAIEVQGSGHYQNNAFMRDAVKREALRKAGIDLIEILESWTPEDIAHRVRSQLQDSRSNDHKEAIPG